MPELYDAAQAFKAALIQQQTQESLAMAVQWQRQLATIRDEMAAFGRDLARRRAAGEEIKYWRVAKMQRYQALEAQAVVALEQYAQWLTPEVESGQRVFFEAGVDQSNALIRLADTSDILQSFDRVPVRAVEQIVGTTKAGTPLSRVLLNSTNNLPAVRNALIDGIAQGKNPNVVARSMAGAFNEGLSKSITVARTEQMRAHYFATQTQYQEAEIRRYQRIATLDDRVCVACAALNGTIYRTSELMAQHPNCRCTLAPIVPGAPKPDVPGFEPWLREQTEERQRAFFGPARFDLWKGGTQLADMAEIRPDRTWGPTPRILTLAELGAQ